MGFLFRTVGARACPGTPPHDHGEEKHRYQDGIPFAIEPVVYDFAINETGSRGDLLTGIHALMPRAYYALTVPHLLRKDPRELTPDATPGTRTYCRLRAERAGAGRHIAADRGPHDAGPGFAGNTAELARSDPRAVRIRPCAARTDQSGPAERSHRSRPEPPADQYEPSMTLPTEMSSTAPVVSPVEFRKIGEAALAEGAVAVLTLAAGAGSRWTKGAGTVKALHPFCRLGGVYRTFIETHLAKSRATSRASGAVVPHIISTGYLTDEAIRRTLSAEENYGYGDHVYLSPGSSIGLRLIPTVRDLRFAWMEMPQQLLDAQAQKVLESLHASLMDWAERSGEASDYTDNTPMQCLHPVGHWYEVPTLFRNGVLATLLRQRPGLKYLLVHNVDTMGAHLDPALLGRHIVNKAGMTVEVIHRRLEDRGGGLARTDGRVRLIEGLALPREEYEFRLSYYNSATYWLDIDRVLHVFGLTRGDLEDRDKVARAVRDLALRMPTYITLKNVKKRWGKGQEDVYPTLQFEKLWGDMTILPGLDCSYVAVPRERGQQLKEPAQMDGWLRDGSAAYVDSLCDWKR